MSGPRRREAQQTSGPGGFLVVDKPGGWTSHDVVDAARRWLGTRRVGHLGTLDPLATGVLPLAVREATKLASFVPAAPKQYLASFRLGVETDTLDAEGRVLRTHAGPLPDETALRAALRGFMGEIQQVPPMFSAIKQGGRALHTLARAGVEVERAPRRVTIERLELRAFHPPDAEVEVTCSAGTYVRSLASDLGARLGCGAHVSALRRTRSGPFDLTLAAPIAQLDAEARAGSLAQRILPAAQALGIPELRLEPEPALRVRAGGRIDARCVGGAARGARFAALDGAGELLALLEVREDRWLAPLRVLRPLG